jgi:Xaa-Pro aminopeptidase
MAAQLIGATFRQPANIPEGGAMNILLLPEKDRRAQLEAAEQRAFALFDAIEEADLIAPGKTETELEAEIYELAKRCYGVEKHWHRRVVRTGPNTLCTFHDDPPVRTIAADDIVYLDLGPVFAEWEADVGRSYALGDDPDKHRIVADLTRTFDLVKAHYERTPDITGAELYRVAQQAALDAGWEFGGIIAGHIVGEFPHAQLVPGNKAQHRIGPLTPSACAIRTATAEGATGFWKSI